MSRPIREEIYNACDLKETQELIEIWQKNDRVEWEDVTFDVIAEILMKRLGELPLQNQPIYEHIKTDPINDYRENTPLDKYLEAENLPEFYDPWEVFRLDKWIKRAAIAAVVFAIITGLLEYPRFYFAILSFFNSNLNRLLAGIIAFGVDAAAVVLQCLISYYVLISFGYILKILMEMEFNSRIVKNRI